LGLMYTTVASASLFPNLEGIFTAVLAWVVFKENTDHKIVGGDAVHCGGWVTTVMHRAGR